MQQRDCLSLITMPLTHGSRHIKFLVKGRVSVRIRTVVVAFMIFHIPSPNCKAYEIFK